MPADGVVHVGRELVLLRNGAYEWVDIKRFWLPARLTDPAVALQLLMESPRYRDHYTSATSQDEDAGDIHGPYRLDQLVPASYDPIDEGTALRTIQDFVGDATHLSVDLQADLDFRVHRQIRKMPVRYRLRDFENDALHDFGWVLGRYTELVVMDLDQHELLLIVAAGD